MLARCLAVRLTVRPAVFLAVRLVSGVSGVSGVATRTSSLVARPARPPASPCISVLVARAPLVPPGRQRLAQWRHVRWQQVDDLPILPLARRAQADGQLKARCGVVQDVRGVGHSHMCPVRELGKWHNAQRTPPSREGHRLWSGAC